MIIIYHSRDLDGYTSGAIAKLKYPDGKLIGYDYNQPIPYDQIPEGEPIIMMDVSLPMPEMEKMSIRANHMMTWIDHHASAILDYRNYVGSGKQFCIAVLEDGIAACEGTWKYLFPNKKMPIAVQLLGEYDTWRNKDKDRWENIILPFQFGMRIECTSPETFDKNLFSSFLEVKGDPLASIIDQGKIILRYQDQTNAIQCKKSFVVDNFHGYRALCLNIGLANSDAFKSIWNPELHDIMIAFQFDGKEWSHSLYTLKEDIDVSLIAKKLGGGGHKAAAGFKSKTLLLTPSK